MHSIRCNEINQSKSGVRFGSFWKNSLTWIGQHSLEIYLLHGFMMNLLKTDVLFEFNTFTGITLTSINYFVTVILSSVIAMCIEKNDIIKICGFGKIRK